MTSSCCSHVENSDWWADFSHVMRAAVFPAVLNELMARLSHFVVGVHMLLQNVETSFIPVVSPCMGL